MCAPALLTLFVSRITQKLINRGTYGPWKISKADFEAEYLKNSTS